jgi:hypothetical protein
MSLFRIKYQSLAPSKRLGRLSSGAVECHETLKHPQYRRLASHPMRGNNPCHQRAAPVLKPRICENWASLDQTAF